MVNTSDKNSKQKSAPISLVRKYRRAESGLTSAIILIAFVIVASSIAFVVLNLGSDFISSTRDTGNRAQEQSS
ncbi:MAG: hypothetical protein OEZ01_17380, partial [Candidatus Heimdallarchaeota archaeon]|nr:hypothetical protein [Candidatus Heimdallarchaeota archaeon]